MDLNVIVLAGRLATPPEVRQFDSGSRMLRLLVTVRSTEPRRRVDVVPVTWWDDNGNGSVAGIDQLLTAEAGARVWVAGSIQRRFWEGNDGRRSKLEVVAASVQVLDASDETDDVSA